MTRSRLDSASALEELALMSDVESILVKLRNLGLEETRLVGQAVRNHLEELDDAAAYDEAKARDEEIESLDVVLARFKPSAST